MAARAIIKLRRDLSNTWQSVNTILSLGEPGFETDTKRLKIGDGTSAWNNLDYVAGSGGGAATPAFSAGGSVGAPQIGATSAQAGVIAGAVAGAVAGNQSTDRPIKAYVVGNDITTEQQLQRRLRTMARLGG